jgi:hypothetical protein
MARRNRTANASPGDPLWTSHLKPAPGELRIVQAFVNTEGGAKATDEIASRGGSPPGWSAGGCYRLTLS